jgi:hypothetical protein
MTDPFAASHPSVILQAAKALNACIASCWPRLSTNQQEESRLIRVLSICWLNIHDGDLDSNTSLPVPNELAVELKQTAQMIKALRESSGSKPPPGMDKILTTEPKLAELFEK